MPKIPRVQLLTNCNIPCSILQQRVRLAIEHGIDCLQYRAGPEETNCYDNARIFAELCHKTKTQYIVNDHVHIAARLRTEGFDAGVWLGQNDMPAAAARTVLGDEAFIGLSVNTDTEAAAANYAVAANGIFPCSSNPYAQQMGLGGLQTLRQMSTHPMITIGGITHNNLPHVLATGVDGVALSGAILRADNIEHAAKCFVDLYDCIVYEV